MAEASPDDLRRRIAGWRAAEQRERAVRREEPILEPARSLELALELCELDATDPDKTDPVRERGVEATRDAWSRLRKHFRCQASSKHHP
jgi:hypothetical protein